MASTIFVIDSSPAVRRMVEQISTPAGYEVVGFQDGPTALDAARALTPGVIIADYHLDNMTFSGFCKEVHKLDCLAETYIISLIGAADRPDETHLRSLGVKAFLKKPFQTEHLLDLIKDLDQSNLAHTNGGRKKRSWPPVSSETDFDDEEGCSIGDADQTGEIEAAVIPPSGPARPETSSPAEPSKQPEREPEEAMKGLFAQLLQSMSEKAEKRIAETLPEIVEKNLVRHVGTAVESEVTHQLGAALTQERLAQIVDPLLGKELPRILSREIPAFEPIVRRSLSDFAGPVIKEHVEHVMRDQADIIEAAVTDAVRQHLKTMEGEIREEIRKAALARSEQLAEGIIRDAVADEVRKAVREVVPGIAEEHIKLEIRRLTKAA